MLAERANEVGRQFLTLVLITADAATPNGLALVGLADRLRLWLDVLLVVVVGGRRHIRQRFHLCDGTDEEHVRAEVNGLFHIGRDEGVRATCDGPGNPKSKRSGIGIQS